MDVTRKRRLEDDNNNNGDASSDVPRLTPTESRKMIERFSKDQLVDLLQDAVIHHVDVRSSVRLIADADLTVRKLFVRGLGLESTTESLVSIFSAYGELDDAVVVVDKTTGKSKGYGFVVFKHVDGALLALREPSKKVGGYVAVCQLASTGSHGGDAADVYSRKIFVGNVPIEADPEKLLLMFSMFGEIEEGPLGFDKQTGKSRGFAMFVYKTAKGAQNAIADSVKNFDGRQLFCRLAIEGKKKTEPAGGGAGTPGDVQVDGFGVNGQGSMREGQYGPGGFGNFGGYPGGMQGPPQSQVNPPSMDGLGVASGANRFGSGGGGGCAGYGGAGNGPFGGYNMGLGYSVGHGSFSGAGAGGFGGAGAGVGSGGLGGRAEGNFGNFGGAAGGTGVAGPGGASMYRPSASGYPESRLYGLASSVNYPAQLLHHQLTGNSPAPNVPPSGLCPRGPPYN